MSPALHQRRLSIWVVALLLVTAVIPASAVFASPVSAEAPNGPDVSFAEPGSYHEQRGDVAEITLALSDTDTVTVRLGNESANYSATVTVEDADGDGRATVRLNTYDLSYRTAGDDSLTVREETDASGPLAVGKYDLKAWTGSEVSGTASAGNVLTVAARSADDLRTWVAPESADISNLSDLDAARESGNLTRNSVVAKNDTFVLELSASGLEGAIAAQRGENTTVKFSEFVGTDDVSLVVYDLPGPERRRAHLDVTDASTATVIADERNDSYYLVSDLRNVSMSDRNGDALASERDLWGAYRANFTLSDDSELTDERESLVGSFEVENREADVDSAYETDRTFLVPAPNQTVSGATTIAPGSAVTVRVHNESGDELGSETVRVEKGTEAGQFTATFDFGDVPDRTEVVVTVEDSDGRMLLGSATGREGTSGTITTPTATVELADRGQRDTSVVVETVSLSHGGYVAVHRRSADGEVLGRSDRLAPGEEDNPFVSFDPQLKSNATVVAVAHRAGPDGSLGEPYTENGSVVADSAKFTTTPETTRTTATETTTTETTTTTTADSPMQDGTTAETATTDSEGPVPGFGVPAALAALAVGLLARRKRNGE